MTTDLITRFLALAEQIAGISKEQALQIDVAVRTEFGGSANIYVRRKSPFLREVIRAKYDGTPATTRRLAAEYEVSEATVRRIGQRVRVTGPARTPEPSPRLTGKAKKVANSP